MLVVATLYMELRCKFRVTEPLAEKVCGEVSQQGSSRVEWVGRVRPKSHVSCAALGQRHGDLWHPRTWPFHGHEWLPSDAWDHQGCIHVVRLQEGVATERAAVRGDPELDRPRTLGLLEAYPHEQGRAEAQQTADGREGLEFTLSAGTLHSTQAVSGVRSACYWQLFGIIFFFGWVVLL